MSANHFYRTEISSPLSRLFNVMNFDLFEGSAGKDNDQYQIPLNQSLINEDPFLAFMHPHCQGVLGMLMLPPSNMYNWHKDLRNACNLNFINCTRNKHTFFQAQNAEEHSYFNNKVPINTIGGYKPLVEMKINPQQWVGLNSQNLHAGINFDTEPKFLLQYCIKLTSGLDYFDVVELIKQYEQSLTEQA